MERLEDRMSEWDALTSVREKGCTALLVQAKELQASSREFWKLKEAARRLIWAKICTRLIRVSLRTFSPNMKRSSMPACPPRALRLCSQLEVRGTTLDKGF